MIHEILPVGRLQCNCSIFGDETTRQAMVVDPGDEIDRILETLARHSLTVTAIVITHAHIDHIGGARKLKLATGAPVYMNLEDSKLQDMLDVQANWLGMRTPEAVDIDVPMKDGDKLLIGATEVHVLHTPGHTPGSICLWLPGVWPGVWSTWTSVAPMRSLSPSFIGTSMSTASGVRMPSQLACTSSMSWSLLSSRFI